VSRPSIIHEHAVTSAAYRLGGFSSDKDFLVAFAVVLMGLVILSNAVPALMAWRSAKFAQRLGAELQQDIYRGFLHRDLALAARVNSAHMVRTVVHGTNRFVYMCVQPLLNLVSSGFVVLLITVGLLLYNPVVALSAMLLIGGGYLLVFRVTKTLLQRHGELTWAATTQKQKLLNESLGGLKEIRLAGTEGRYGSELASITHLALRSEVLINLLGELPRYVLESIALCAMLGLGIVMLTSFADATRIVAVLSLYAMAGYKLLPAAQSVFRSAGQLHTNAQVVEDIRAEVMAGRAVKASVGESGGPMPVGDVGRVAAERRLRVPEHLHRRRHDRCEHRVRVVQALRSPQAAPGGAHGEPR
jgi:HlyD family secretion protein